MDFDAHVHLEYGSNVDKYAETLKKNNMRAGISSCGPVFGQPGNDAVGEALRKYPDVIVGFGYIALGRGDTPGTVENLYKKGFKALKVIIPKKDYDDKEFYPIYKKAEELKMPILFHTGVMARTDGNTEKYKHIPAVANLSHKTMDISSKRMEPICLDAIARAFPDLKIIMAHFGSPGVRDNAAGLIRWHPNLYADLTYFIWGFETKISHKRNVDMIKTLVKVKNYEKLVFGTDNSVGSQFKMMPKYKKAISDLLDALKVNKIIRKRIMGETMEGLLGIK